MTRDELQKEIQQDRRGFIKKVLGGTIAGSLLLVLPANATEIAEQIPGMRAEESVFTKKRFAFVVDITACIGCGSCCIADKAEYDVPDGNYRTWVERYVIDDHDNVYVDSPDGGLGGYTTPRSGLPNPTRDTFFVPKLCNMCEKPSCVQVCPVGATYKTEDGFVLIDKDRCVGCSYCIQACPYSVRFINPKTHTAEKCTWCYHRVRKGLLPACVSVCPVHARKFGDLNDKNSEVWKILHEPHVISVLKPDMGNKPALHYVGLRREVV
ncbi:MAG: tetrathionate reductase subunit B [Desulforhopalus sp.]|jgi:tetrathionate reductase subunit B